MVGVPEFGQIFGTRPDRGGIFGTRSDQFFFCSGPYRTFLATVPPPSPPGTGRTGRDRMDGRTLYEKYHIIKIPYIKNLAVGGKLQFPEVLEGLGSSGKLVGIISAYPVPLRLGSAELCQNNLGSIFCQH